jgi:hypothetical protein
MKNQPIEHSRIHLIATAGSSRMSFTKRQWRIISSSDGYFKQNQDKGKASKGVRKKSGSPFDTRANAWAYFTGVNLRPIGF